MTHLLFFLFFLLLVGFGLFYYFTQKNIRGIIPAFLANQTGVRARKRRGFEILFNDTRPHPVYGSRITACIGKIDLVQETIIKNNGAVLTTKDFGL